MRETFLLQNALGIAIQLTGFAKASSGTPILPNGSIPGS